MQNLILVQDSIFVFRLWRLLLLDILICSAYIISSIMDCALNVIKSTLTTHRYDQVSKNLLSTKFNFSTRFDFCFSSLAITFIGLSHLLRVRYYFQNNYTLNVIKSTLTNHLVAFSVRVKEQVVGWTATLELCCRSPA